MNLLLWRVVGLGALSLASSVVWGEEPEPQPDARAAVVKSLPLLTAGAIGHREQRSCFSCHNQGVPILALAAARERGLAIDGEELHFQVEHIAGFLARNRESFLSGSGTGGKADTAGSALTALAAASWPADESTSAVVEYLLRYQGDKDHWSSSSNRPPSEASDFATNYVALTAIQAYAGPGQRERVAKRVTQVREWLVRGERKPKDNEDRVFRLRALQSAGAGDAEISSAAKELLETQQEDGGWRQLDTLASDAYATGTALAALHQVGGLAPTDPAYRRGVAFLLKSQLADGSWRIKSRSKPFQPYFETGFPHEKDQFISSAATGWATIALLNAVER